MDLNFYKHEEDRIKKELLERTPGTNEYQALLRDMHDLIFVAVQSLDAIERLAFAEENETSNAPINITPLKPVEPEPEPEPEPESSVTFDELKSRFVTAARTGVDVGAILADRGYNKLSEVPKTEYDKLLATLSEVT